jgi:hypothetical protein
MVIQLLGRSEHATANLFAGGPKAVQHPRDGRGRDPGACGDVLETAGLRQSPSHPRKPDGVPIAPKQKECKRFPIKCNPLHRAAIWLPVRGLFFKRVRDHCAFRQTNQPTTSERRTSSRKT